MSSTTLPLQVDTPKKNVFTVKSSMEDVEDQAANELLDSLGSPITARAP